MASWNDGWAQQRSLHIFSDIDQNMVGGTIQQLYGLAALSSEPVTLFINSNGGEVLHAFALIEMVQCCPAPVRAVALGRVFSAALLIYMSVGERLALKNTLFMAHDFTTGNSSYTKAQHQGEWLRKRIIALYRTHTKLSDSTMIEHAFLTDDFFFDEQEALGYGIVDSIIDTLPVIPFKT